MAPTYTLTPEAYALPILHAAQSPSTTVQGLLLSASASSSSTTNPSSVEVTRAIPLIHIDSSSSVYTEVALEHAEVYARREGLSVVGVYEAGTAPTDAGLSRAARGLLRGLKAKEGRGEVFALSVDNARLGKGENPYSLYLASDPSRPLPASSLTTATADLPKRTLALIRNRAKSGDVKVHDWDSHMEDSKADWLVNSAARELIKSELS